MRLKPLLLIGMLTLTGSACGDGSTAGGGAAQRAGVAGDAAVKSDIRTTMTALEAYQADRGTYEGFDARSIGASEGVSLSISTSPNSYTITGSHRASDNRYRVVVGAGSSEDGRIVLVE